MAGNNKNFAVDDEEIEALRRIKDDSRDHWYGETEQPSVVDLLIERGMLSAKWQEESSIWHGNLTVTAFGSQFLRLFDRAAEMDQMQSWIDSGEIKL